MRKGTEWLPAAGQAGAQFSPWGRENCRKNLREEYAVKGSTVETGNDYALLPAVQGQAVGETTQPAQAQGNTFSYKTHQNVLFQLFQTFTGIQKNN